MKLLRFLLFTIFSTSCWAFEAADGLILSDSYKAAEVRYGLIKNESEAISVTVFTLKNDLSSLAHIAYLREKAKQGVKVRLLIDSYGNGLSQDFLDAIIADGVKVRIFNKIQFNNLGYAFNRNHTKMMLFENQKSVIVGDRNFKDMYFPTSSKTTQSVDVLINDASIFEDTLTYFTKIWHSSKPLNLRTRFNPLKISIAEAKLDKVRNIVERWMTNRKKEDPYDWRKSLSEFNYTELIMDEVDLAKKKEKGHHRAIKKLFDDAEKEIKIITPYLVLDPDIKQSIREALERGVKVEVITNSVKSSDIKIAAIAAKKDLLQLLTLGADINLFTGPELLHAKVYMADGHKVYIGSYNLDMISRYKNIESGVIIHSDSVYQDLYKNMRMIGLKTVKINTSQDLANQKLFKCGNYLLKLMLDIPFLRNFL